MIGRGEAPEKKVDGPFVVSVSPQGLVKIERVEPAVVEPAVETPGQPRQRSVGHSIQ